VIQETLLFLLTYCNCPGYTYFHLFDSRTPTQRRSSTLLRILHVSINNNPFGHNLGFIAVSSQFRRRTTAKC